MNAEIEKKIHQRREVISACKNIARTDLDWLRRSTVLNNGYEKHWFNGVRSAIINRIETGERI